MEVDETYFFHQKYHCGLFWSGAGGDMAAVMEDSTKQGRGVHANQLSEPDVNEYDAQQISDTTASPSEVPVQHVWRKTRYTTMHNAQWHSSNASHKHRFMVFLYRQLCIMPCAIINCIQSRKNGHGTSYYP